MAAFAKPNFSGNDKFSLKVVGKNLHEEGYSTVEITGSRRDAPMTLSAVGPGSRCDWANEGAGQGCEARST